MVDAAVPEPARPLRVAVVGAMGYGVNHLRALRGLAAEGRAVLVAVVDRRPLEGEAAELAGDAAYHQDLADVLAVDPPDIVTIATPIPSHAPLATAAMRAGCHVLLEKPPTASLAAYEALLAVARETRRACQVGFQANGSSAYAVIDEVVADEEIGEVTGIGVVGTWVRPTSYFERAPWAGRRRLDGVDVVDGVVTNPLAHAVAAALRIDGSTRAEDVAVVEAELFRANDIEADDTSSVRIITTGGRKIALGLTVCAAEASEPRVIVHGTDGQVVFRYKTDEVDVDGVSGRRTVTCTTTPLLTNLVDHLHDADVPLLSSLEDTGAFMRVLEAVRTADEPAPIPAALVDWREDEEGRHVVVHDVEHWCARVADELRTFTTLGAPWAPAHAALARLTVGGADVATYVDGAGTSALDSPRPHLHPVRTLAGVCVTDVAPSDHTWHAGVGLAVQDVDGNNLWGGRTYLPGRGYTWRPDHGRITHEGWVEPPTGAVQPAVGGAEPATGAEVSTGRAVERLAWRGHDGTVLLTETRTLTWTAAPEGWELGVESVLTAGGAPVTLGSPGTNGREGGGYGGFFWRLPSCTDVDVHTPEAAGEEAVHGTVAPWLAWSASTSGGNFTLVLAGATSETAADPWFVRVSGYPGIGSALAWEEPVVVTPGKPLTRAFRVLVADGRLSGEAVASAGARLATGTSAPA